MAAYIHQWLQQYFDMLRQRNKLTHVKKRIQIDGKAAEFDGEVDENGDCVGVGTATEEGGDKWHGTWMDNERHGVCRFSSYNHKTYSDIILVGILTLTGGDVFIREYKNGQAHGFET